MPLPRLRRLALPLLAAALASCGESVHVPPPETGSAARPVPEPEPSTVVLPVTVSLASVAAQVETLVPRGQDREDDWRPLGRFPVVGTLYVKELWEREPLELGIHGDHVNVRAHVRYRARVAARACVLGACRWVPLAGCGQDGAMPTLDVGLRTALTWHRDWTLTPHTTAAPVSPGRPCRLTEAKVDVTDRIQRLVQDLLDHAAPQIDAKLRDAAGVRRHVQTVWTAMQKPISASKGVWLVLQPEAAAATPPTGLGTTLHTTVSLVIRPRVVVGDKPVQHPRPLPPSGDVPPGGGFRVQVVAELPFDAADELLARQLNGRVLTIHGHRVVVRGARLYGGGSRVVLAATLGGDAKGVVYFVGTPDFDPVTQTISVPDLDFSLESRQVLPQIAGWLLYDDLRDQMRAAARFPVADRLAKIRRDVDAALNRPLGRDVRMSGGIDALRPLGVFVFSRSLASVVEAEGHAQVHVDVRAPARRPGAAGADDDDQETNGP